MVNYIGGRGSVNVSEPDFGILVGLAYTGFVQDLRAALQADGHADLHAWVGYVLRALEAKPLNLRDLAQRLGMTSQGAIKIVDHLVADGYIARIGDKADGRVKQLTVTARGRDLLERAKVFHAGYERRLSDRHGPAAVASLKRLLTDMAAPAAAELGERALRPI